MKSVFHSKLMKLEFNFFESKSCGCHNTYTKTFENGTVFIAKGDATDTRLCTDKSYGKCPTYWKVSRKGELIAKKTEAFEEMPSWESVLTWLRTLEILD